MNMRRKVEIDKPEGKLGVLIPGLGGAVSTTFLAGVEAIRNGKALPVGSLTQMATIRLGKRDENRRPKIKEFIPLADLDDLVFGGWDIFPQNCHEAACEAGVLNDKDLAQVASFLENIQPWPGAFNQAYVKNLDGTHVKPGPSHLDLIDGLKADIENFKKET
ncbi:MAG: inositol-3-phosphate synthase, partial [Deltaproteobacteria bacterium]|nr:inositol-3-phosphate synthase [Deltaproteobacteria bacterium]